MWIYEKSQKSLYTKLITYVNESLTTITTTTKLIKE